MYSCHSCHSCGGIVQVCGSDLMHCPQILIIKHSHNRISVSTAVFMVHAWDADQWSILNPCKLTESTREWSSPLSLNNHFCILKMQLFSICRDQYFLIFQLKLFKFDKLCNVVICFTPQSFNHFFFIEN